MPKDIIGLTDENGQLVFGESHVMCNLFSMKALEKIADQELPYHSAHKKVNYLDEDGVLINADKPNAEIGHNESKQKYLHRLQALLQQHLGVDKGHPPYGDG